MTATQRRLRLHDGLQDTRLGTCLPSGAGFPVEEETGGNDLLLCQPALQGRCLIRQIKRLTLGDYVFIEAWGQGV